MIVNSFLGIRNTSPSRSIPDNALSDAVDVDIDDILSFLDTLFVMLDKYEIIRWNLRYNYRYNYVSKIDLYKLDEGE